MLISKILKKSNYVCKSLLRLDKFFRHNQNENITTKSIQFHKKHHTISKTRHIDSSLRHTSE